MRIKCDNNRMAISAASIIERALNDGTMSGVNAVEYSEREKKRTGNSGKCVDGIQNLHDEFRSCAAQTRDFGKGENFGFDFA